MKAKKFQLMVVLAALLVTLNLQAQVTIGSLNPPANGAILDLNSTTKGGLLFPNVTIESLTAIPTQFTNQPSGGEITDLEGMVVYNTTDAQDINNTEIHITPGLYVWTGVQWLSLSDLAKIAELRDEINSLIGNLTTDLTTTDRTTVVAGINEVNDKVDDLNTKVGDLDDISDLTETSVVDGINVLNTKIGDFSTIIGLPNGSVAADLSTLNDRVGNLGSISAGTLNSSLVTAINSVKGYAETLSQAQEVPNSPFYGYAAFKADAGSTAQMQTYTLPKFAYVTFTSTLSSSDAADVGVRWNEVVGNGDTWRLDFSKTDGKWHLTSSLTVASTATLPQGSSMAAPPNLAGGNTNTVSNWLSIFHDNLIALLGKFSGGAVTVAAGGTGVDATSTTANSVFASPSGSAGIPTFRKLALTDLPTTSTANTFLKVGTASSTPAYSAIGAGDITSGTLAIARGGTGKSADAVPNTVFAGPGTGSANAAPAFRALVAADLPTVTLAKGGTGSAISTNGTAGQPLVSNGSGGTQWGTAVPTKTTGTFTINWGKIARPAGSGFPYSTTFTVPSGTTVNDISYQEISAGDYAEFVGRKYTLTVSGTTATFRIDFLPHTAVGATSADRLITYSFQIYR